MKYRTLGASGARVSELCLGAMTFGEADEKSMMHKVSTPEAESLALMSRALEAGVNFWDTANVYGQDGLSERVIGKWFAETKRRHDVVLATKCRFGMGPGPNDRGASRLHIKRALEDSLRRLGTDYVDLYQIHMQDAQTPEDEVVAAPVVGYGAAWIGHFFVEKNKPASFKYPLWSFRADWVMWSKIIRRQMGAELERAEEIMAAREERAAHPGLHAVA